MAYLSKLLKSFLCYSSLLYYLLYKLDTLAEPQKTPEKYHQYYK